MRTTKQPSLHSMLDAYSKHIESESFGQAAHTANRLGLVSRLKEVHADVPIASLNQHEVQALMDHWRSRPLAKSADRPIAAATAKNHISELRRFLLWLHAASLSPWSLPPDFHRLRMRPHRLMEDMQRRAVGHRTYSIGELRLLYQHAEGMERLMLLLGLNCGFGAAEMGRLRVADVRLRNQSRHPVADNFGSVLLLCRPRTNQVGTWPLWPETVEAFEIVLKERCEDKDLVFQTQTGRPLYRDNAQDPSFLFVNLWRRLTNRVKEHHSEFPNLPLGSLRRTFTDLIRQHCSGDDASAFLGHRPTVLADHYLTTGCRGQVEACQRLRNALDAVFEP